MTDVSLENADGLGTLGRHQPVSEVEARHEAIADAVLPGQQVGAVALPRDHRFVVSRGQGARVQDESGNWYIDYIVGAGAMILGHAHPAVEAAAIEQLRLGTHFFSLPSPTTLDYVQELVDAIPCAEKVMFTTTGSESTFYAMRIARAHTGRSKILKFEGGYHGSHDYALVSSMPTATTNYPTGKLDTDGVPAGLDESVLIAPFNDLTAVEQIVTGHRNDLAAIIVEPIQRILAPNADFLSGLRRIADENDVVLIFDEVVTGFRLAYGGAQEYFGVKPDLACYGKIVGGGFAQGVVAGRAEVMDAADPSRKSDGHFAFVTGTFNGNPMAAAAANATLQELRKPGVYKKLNGDAADFRKEMQAIIDQHGLTARVLGEGSMWQVLFCAAEPKNHAEYLNADMATTRAFDEVLIRHGLYFIPLVRRLLSIAHGPDEFEVSLRAVDDACRQVA